MQFASRSRCRPWVIIAAIVVGPDIASAQEITITPRLRTGDEFRLEVKRSRQDSSQPRQNIDSTTTVDVRVISAGAEGITLEWILGGSTLSNSQLSQEFAAGSEMVKGLRMRLTLNADGEYIGLANEAEVAAILQAASDAVGRKVSEKMPEDQRPGFQALLKSILSPAFLIGAATHEVQTYFGLNGVSISIGESIEVDIEQPNPLGGGALPATFHVRGDSATVDSAVLSTTTTYGAAALREVMRSFAAQAGKPIPQEQLRQLESMEMRDHGKFVFDRSVGLMREVVVSRRVTAGPITRSDGWHIRLVKAPTR